MMKKPMNVFFYVNKGNDKVTIAREATEAFSLGDITEMTNITNGGCLKIIADIIPIIEIDSDN